MALSEIQQAQVTTRLTVFCNPRVPAAVRNQVQVGFRIKGSEVVLFEKRLFDKPLSGSATPAAQRQAARRRYGGFPDR